MISFILYIFFVQIAYLSSDNEIVQDQILKRFISALKDETTIEKWREVHNIDNINGEKTFKRVIKNVVDIISVIKSEKYTVVSPLTNNTFMNYKKIGYPFYETWASIQSVRRIFEINDNENLFGSRKYDMSKFDEEVLYKEYSNISNDIGLLVAFLGREDFHKNLFSVCKDQYKNWISDKKDEDLSNSTARNDLCFEKFDKNMDLSHDLIESILPVEYEKPVYVLAHSVGFERSRKCSGEGVTEFIRDESTRICSQEMLNVCPLSGDGYYESRISMENFMERPFICDKTIAKTLIVFFHFYSQDMSGHTTYEIILTKDNEYQITWSFYNTRTDSQKDNWLDKEIEDLSDQYIIPKFGFIVEYDIVYSTVKSEDTENEGIETRLILLECGHQLGLDLIDEYFANFYDSSTKSVKCHICRKDVDILGSYDAVVYKCKD